MRTCLITGGTGSLAKAFIPIALSNFKRVRILSRGEHKQKEFEEFFNNDRIDYLIGDVRDYERMVLASYGCDAVFHFAAFKNVDKAEYDPWECVLTNVAGARNVIRACQLNRVGKAIFTSTDKAVAPINVYGASKLLAEKLWIQGNVGSFNTSFSAVRYGNVFGSNSSVIQVWKRGGRKITDPMMTRFFITLEKAAKFVWSSFEVAQGGEVFIPRMSAVNLQQLMHWTVGKPHEVLGKRPGEKVHECLIIGEEADMCTRLSDFYVRWPSHDLFPCHRYGEPVKHEIRSNTVRQFSEAEVRGMWASI